MRRPTIFSTAVGIITGDTVNLPILLLFGVLMWTVEMLLCLHFWRVDNTKRWVLHSFIFSLCSVRVFNINENFSDILMLVDSVLVRPIKIKNILGSSFYFVGERRYLSVFFFNLEPTPYQYLPNFWPVVSSAYTEKTPNSTKKITHTKRNQIQETNFKKPP